MAKLNSYKELIVWQRSIDLSVEVYHITKLFPREELYGLTSQFRRASNSVSLNIAEGFGRNSTKSYMNFLRNAKASLDEVESGFVLAVKLGFTEDPALIKLNSIISETMKMLVSLIKSLHLKVKSKIKKALVEVI